MASASSTAVKPLYLSRPYLFETIARVISTGTSAVKNRQFHWVRLDQTIFHPQGGGQPSDQGTIDGKKVVAVSKTLLGSLSSFQIDHCFDASPGFEVGQTVSLSVDPVVRRFHIRLHSAGHLIGSIVETYFKQLVVVRAQHFPKDANMVFGFRNGVAPKVPLQAQAIQQRVESSLALLTRHGESTTLSQGAQGERLVQMGEFEPVPCGGTHVENTCELETVIIKQVKMSAKGPTIVYDVPPSQRDAVGAAVSALIPSTNAQALILNYL